MKAQPATRETTTVADDILRVAAFAAAMRAICVANQLQMLEQRLTFSRPPQSDVELDFTGRVPFGFAFTEGHQATFHVPSSHRFVIEHINVSCWPPSQHLDVQLVTRSRHMFRSLTVTNWPRHTSSGQEDDSPSVAPIQVHGSSASTFFFGNGEVHNSSTVPPDTYLQVWGHLEPTDDATSS